MNPSLSIFALVLFVMTVELCQPMNQRDYQAQVIDAADRLTDELLGYFGELLQSVVRDVTVGIANTAPSTASKNRAVAEKKEQKSAPKPSRPSVSKKKQVAKKPSTHRLASSGRRSAQELDKDAARVVRYLKEKKAEMRIEQINTALGTTTPQLMRPIRRLLASGEIQKRGTRRSTTYFVPASSLHD
ncbi:MAG TPA: hypothetical protein PLJ27_04365 [Polyangiaceae bacterium]|mgnify:CR=1 FL=1|jgi:hypothetical protein|nr:MAG: hypothetical protein BWY17_00926 [Deltaproteobacteria bacterium ADurb.Bin207]HNS95557.1 hypothetical protein [Polyangiaceae bacterium]HNZ21329.1 hypothetical protein [Polyangiaceae bacterium]HOD20986.1 hypothetical protein [Polyangiaceae bacterium]HOE47496.1 hypothetical protein [Polyangiaceae bacterium]